MLNKAVHENRLRAIAEERTRQSQLEAAELADKEVPFLHKVAIYTYLYNILFEVYVMLHSVGLMYLFVPVVVSVVRQVQHLLLLHSTILCLLLLPVAAVLS
jgi:hypothetical protein